MPNPTPTLTDEQREALIEALRFDRCEYGCAITYTEETVRHDLEPLIARMVADAEQRGRAEVSAAVALREAAEEFATGGWSDAFAAGEVDDDVSAVWATERWFLDRADRIGGAPNRPTDPPRCCDLANYPLGCPVHQESCEHAYARAVYGDWHECPECGGRFRPAPSGAPDEGGGS